MSLVLLALIGHALRITNSSTSPPVHSVNTCTMLTLGSTTSILFGAIAASTFAANAWMRVSICEGALVFWRCAVAVVKLWPND